MSESVQSNKVFVYGVSKISAEDIASHFENFGPVKKVESPKHRDYAFVEFFDDSIVRRALEDEEQYIDNNKITVKKAFIRGVRRQNSQNSNHSSSNAIFAPAYKIFVGGLPRAINDEEFRSYFESYGNVVDSIVIRDNATNVSRGFGFVSFDSITAAQDVLGYQFHNLNGTFVEVKVAMPRSDQYIPQMTCLFTPVYPPHYPIVAYQTPTYAADPNWCFSNYIDNNYYVNGCYGYVNPQNLCYFNNTSNVVN